ncbi:MAG: cyclic nucleotide-binding domain-containing protein [Fimbriimonas sp.]|nr:cyclic nucleotide-binding domain-containing protein [Fimbriimonas sp.]
MLSPQDQATFTHSFLVCGLKPSDVEALLALGQEGLYRGGEDLFHHNGADGDLFVILDGRVNILTDEGDKITEAGPGSVVGEISFLDAGPRDASAVAIAHVTALRFPAAELRKRMCGDKELGFRILANLSRILCARMREAEQHLEPLMARSHEIWDTADL